jgi:hypothetical protein
MLLKSVINKYISRVPEVKAYCDRCLESRRWDGSVLLMVIDAAFDSIGLNYFHSVVPKVEAFRYKFVANGKMTSLEDLIHADSNDLEGIWKNKRSWQMARSISAYLTNICKEHNINERLAFRNWAKTSSLRNWEHDAIGTVKGVGLTSFQYLRMMGGIDTVMPDKIVKRVITSIVSEARIEAPQVDLEFIYFVHELAMKTGYRPIELCWMTWLIQSESNLAKMEKYSSILSRI